MILCHRYRFIFLKSRKTASTSLEMALSRLCGPEDVVTSLMQQDERNRLAHGGRLGVNAPKAPGALSADEERAFAERGEWPSGLYHHVPAAAVRYQIAPRIWQDYLKISVERNPWDKAVSFYYWACQTDGYDKISDYATFAAWLDTVTDVPISNWPIYAIDDEIACDWVLRYEDLDNEVARLGARLGAPVALPEQRAKGGHRPAGQSHRDFLTDDVARRIGEICQREIAAFGYEF